MTPPPIPICVSVLRDGSGHTGVRVGLDGLTAPTSTYAIVTGCASAAMVDGKVVRLLRPRSQADIVEVP